jgi:hypothetical protein
LTECREAENSEEKEATDDQPPGPIVRREMKDEEHAANEESNGRGVKLPILVAAPVPDLLAHCDRG